MKIGLQIPTFSWPDGTPGLAAKLSEIARMAEAVGFDSLWVMDHYFQLDPALGKAQEPMLEGYSALSYLAGLTRRMQLGALVTGVVYRYPGFLIKQVKASTKEVKLQKTPPRGGYHFWHCENFNKQTATR